MLIPEKWRPRAAVLLLAIGLPAIAAAQMPNLTYYYHPNFTYPLTPTNTPVTTWPVVLSPTLQGNADATYLSYAMQNNGTALAYDIWFEHLWVDGEAINIGINANLPAGSTSMTYGYGPTNVRGGRHTLGFTVDTFDEISESDETDNAWAHQFVFTPYVLSAATPKWRGPPPNAVGGASDIVDGSLVGYNCDGFRFTSTGWWNVITMYAEDMNADYELELFNPTTGPENGFTGWITGSYNFGGQLEAVIVNRNMVNIVDYDVGVLNTNGTGSFVIEQVVSEPAIVGSSLAIDLGADEYLRIWDTWISTPDLGWITVTVTDLSDEVEPIKVGWAEYDATEMSLSDITTWETTNENGKAWLHRDFTTSGYFGLVVYRDPSEGGLPRSLEVVIEPTPPDLLAYYQNDWYGPLVPTPDVMTAMPPAVPDTLHGYTPHTYLNFCVGNVSNAWTPPIDIEIIPDGLPWSMPFHSPVLAPMVYDLQLDTDARELPGGRHVLTLNIDPVDAIHEFNEDNNIWGEQFCWSPLELVPGGQHSYVSPGNVTGGFGTVVSTDPLFYNCNGYRMNTGSTDWEALVLTQGPNSDYDLAVHYALEGVKNGFDDVLSHSTSFQGQTDYVVFNNHLLPPMVHDIGVENFWGDEPYFVEAVGSISLPNPVTGNHGPYTMPISNMLHLYNIYLEQDLYAFRLDNLGGPVDWSIALHPHNEVRPVRQQVVSGGYSNQFGPGDPEWFTVDVPAAGWYGLGVCKATPADFDLEGTYRLTIMQGITGVEDVTDLPTVSVLAGAHPNPFNPQTTISYDLAAAEDVELALYDVKGARVRQLVSGPKTAGRHAAVWDGRNDAGQRVASGVYLARFTAGAARGLLKVVMVK